MMHVIQAITLNIIVIFIIKVVWDNFISEAWQTRIRLILGQQWYYHILFWVLPSQYEVEHFDGLVSNHLSQNGRTLQVSGVTIQPKYWVPMVRKYPYMIRVSKVTYNAMVKYGVVYSKKLQMKPLLNWYYMVDAKTYKWFKWRNCYAVTNGLRPIAWIMVWTVTIVLIFGKDMKLLP